MGLRILHNVPSLSGQHKLTKTTAKLTSSLTKLSTGLRINTGSDDVVGLLKSESLRSSIRGIGVAETNITNAMSMLGVAEGTLAELTELAQKMREKAVAAADATISATDRSNITTALTDLTSEYSRLTNSAAFDGTALLSGTFTSKTFQIGPDAGNTVSLTITDTRASNIGKIAIFTTTVRSMASVGGADVDFDNSSSLTINSVAINATDFTSDGVSSMAASESALAYVNAINSHTSESGVTAKVLSNVQTITYVGGTAAGAGATDYFQLNGITFGGDATLTSDDAGIGALVIALNNKSTLTGVTASQDAGNDKLVLTAADGRNIAFKTLTSDSLSNLFGMGTGSVNTSVAFRGTFKMTRSTSFTMDGTSFIYSDSEGTASLGANTTLEKMSVATVSSSSDAIDILDNVIKQLQTRRSEVGSKVIRLEAAQSELYTRVENLQSAESSIRDVDVAQETANMTSAQILQQAGIAVLAQANSLPQAALSLLQR